MASIPVKYALLWLVMASCVSESREEKPNIVKLFPNPYWTKTYPTPQNNSPKRVKEDHNISFRCSAEWVRDADVLWFRMNYKDYVAYIKYRHRNDVCSGKSIDPLLVNLHVGNTSCRDGSYELQIRNIDHNYEGGWYCLVINANNNERWRSGYIDLKVDILDESTSRRTLPRASTTSIMLTTVSRHEASSSNPTEAATEYTTESTDKESPSRNTLVPLIGGAAGGGIVLLVLVITGCALYRSKRGSNQPNGGDYLHPDARGEYMGLDRNAVQPSNTYEHLTTYEQISNM